MRICYFGNAASLHLVRWARYFQTQGHDMHLLTFHPPEYDLQGVAVHYVESKLSRYKDVAFLANKGRIQELLQRIQPDILHAHFLISYGFYAAVLGFRPLVISAWGSDVLIHPQRSLRLRRMGKYAVEKADLLFSESAAATRALIQVLGAPREKIRTVPWGIDVCFFLGQDPPDRVEEFRRGLGVEAGRPIILSPRSVAPVYNIPVMLRAAPAVIREHPKAVFVILRGFGDQRYEEAMKKLAAELGVGDHVRFISRTLAPAEMRLMYKNADILVSVPWSDSASVALVEGMLCGLIPVVSDLESNRDVVRDGANGYVVPVGDSARLAERVNYALQHLDECKQQMASANRTQVAQSRRMETVAGKIAAVYGELTPMTGRRAAAG